MGLKVTYILIETANYKCANFIQIHSIDSAYKTIIQKYKHIDFFIYSCDYSDHSNTSLYVLPGVQVIKPCERQTDRSSDKQRGLSNRVLIGHPSGTDPQKLFNFHNRIL